MIDVGLIDHHCHGVLKKDLDRSAFEAAMSESYMPPPMGTSQFSKPLGLLIRRHCSSVLDLEPFADANVYLERRLALGPDEVNRRFLNMTGIDRYLVDTGNCSPSLASCAEMSALSTRQTDEIVRIEAVIESVAALGGDAATFSERCQRELHRRAEHARGLKSVIAYRATFDIDQTRPTPAEVEAAAGTWLRQLNDNNAAPRLIDTVLLRFGIWIGLDLCQERKFPMQLHVGFGDPDVYMHACDPTHFTDFIREAEKVEVPITLLHNYPFIREAGWLAEIFQNVYYDVGAILNWLGPSAIDGMREALHMGPFSKHMFSSDAIGLPELYYLGATQFRTTLAKVLDEWIAEGACTGKDAEEIVFAIARGNAERIYKLNV